MARAVLAVFETYQKARVEFVQTIAELATRPQNIEVLQNAGVMQLLRPLLLDNVPSIQQSSALALGRLANYNEELAEALETIETLRADLNETNLLNAKLLYVNKVFKANNLTEAQKANVIASFDKAETVKEVKLVFETISESVATKKEVVKESRGFASAAAGVAQAKPEVISEANDVVRRMQKLAGIIK